MIDESLDTKKLSDVPQPWEFRAKSAWQRLIVMMGGIFFNAITGLLIYTCITFSLGDTYLTKEEMNKHGIIPNETGKNLGFETGDKIININGNDFEKFADLLSPYTLLAPHGYYTVIRHGKNIRIDIPANFIEKIAATKKQGTFIAPLMPYQIGNVQPGSGAEKAGLQTADSIIAINGEHVAYFQSLRKILATHAGKEITIHYSRNGISATVVAKVSEDGKLGFQPIFLLAYKQKDYAFWQAIPIGASRAFDAVWTNILAMGKIFKGEISASQSLSGPIGIAQIFGESFHWLNFWTIVGFLSMVLAFINFLPIPALDGGHAIFLLYEIITRRSLPTKFLEIVQKIGLAALLFLTVYAVFNDLRKLF